jgi:hypothetical protein
MLIRAFLLSLVLAVSAPTVVSAQPAPNPAAQVDLKLDDPIAELARIKTQFSALKQSREQKDDQNAKLIAAAGLLAAVLRFVMSALQRYASMTGQWRDRIPGLMLIMGAFVTVLSRYTAGLDWYQAIMVGGAGPGAVLMDQLGRMMSKEKERRVEAKAASSAPQEAIKPEAAPKAMAEPIDPPKSSEPA